MMTAENKWINDRIGLFTASQVHKLLVTERSGNGFGQTAMGYILEVVGEMLTGERKEQVSSKAIAWGNDHEAEAMIAYTKKTGYADVIYYGGLSPVFFKIEGIPAGGSPDGIVGGRRVVEIKCPYDTGNHIENCIMDVDEFKKSRKEYYAQVQLNMIATGTEVADFCSYDPRIVDENHRISILEVPKDVDFCERLIRRIGEAVAARNEIYRRVTVKAA
jgi:hypothetical protein